MVDVDGDIGAIEAGTVVNFIKQYNMYNMSERYGDSLTPQQSFEITMNTDSGTHFIHAEDSMPTSIHSFVREINFFWTVINKWLCLPLLSPHVAT
jgi:hypothetical protein